MKRSQILALTLLIGAVFWSYYTLMPSYRSDATLSPESFSTDRALSHVQQLSKVPRSVGTPGHLQAKNYILSELKKIGLQPTIQEGYATGGWSNLSKVTNIIARIKGSGNGKALMLLSHYDSAPHTSYGASDAASGVATILEGIRAFLSRNSTPKNDIIILISDAEELGLNGADLFVNQHPWAKEVGLVLNFEARGSGGPSFMLIETNRGNSNLIKAFKAADPEYPVANSLAYSVYKMLPNDTDLTVFREDGDINGFNFAFIGDHFDYHTALDTYQRLDENSLAHQGSYLMPLLRICSNVDLNYLHSLNNEVYFNLPFFGLISYPFEWIWPMWVLAVLIFVLLFVAGVKKEILRMPEALKGFLPLVLVLGINGVIGFLGWQFITWWYPAFNDMLHGFTYNGYIYILFFALLSLTVCFTVYRKFKHISLPNLLTAPLATWLLLCGLIAIFLEGASFFIIPVFMLLGAFALLLYKSKPHPLLLVLLALPAVFIHTPFIIIFPVGLGLKMMFIATLFTSLLFFLVLPFFGSLDGKRYLISWSLLLTIILGITAHIKSGFNEERPKPSSLLYLYNADTRKALWATYDQGLIEWNHQFLGDALRIPKPEEYSTLPSKYRNQFTYVGEAPRKTLPIPQVTVLSDMVENKERILHLKIIPKRNVNRLDIYTNPIMLHAAEINQVPLSKYFLENRRTKLVTHFITDNAATELQLRFPKDSTLNLTLYESSYDLLTHQSFTIPKRPKYSIPMPFVLNDAIVVTRRLKF